MTRVCDRCGANKKEAALTISHAPMEKIAQGCMPKGWRKRAKKYTLCQMCRVNHLKLERRILVDACERMLKLHEDYINQ